MLKYRNKKSNGFDSKKEEKRYNELRLLEMARHVSDLQKQVTFKLEVNGQPICKYKADFTYYENGKLVVEDVKSPVTAKLPLYVVKKKLMKAIFNIAIKET